MRRLTVSRGDRFGRLTVISELSQSRKHRRFECQCDCGAIRAVPLSALRSGDSKSCGCLRDEIATHHGGYKSGEYQSWTHLIARCENAKADNWVNYGGRGIKVCERWRASFANFLADVGSRPGPRYSIDRFPDNDGNYEPGNVRWATMTEQLRNNRRTRWVVDANGKRRPLIEVAEELNICPISLLGRLQRNSPLAKGMSLVPRSEAA